MPPAEQLDQARHSIARLLVAYAMPTSNIAIPPHLSQQVQNGKAVLFLGAPPDGQADRTVFPVIDWRLALQQYIKGQKGWFSTRRFVKDAHLAD
jgi:hypothetical protein